MPAAIDRGALDNCGVPLHCDNSGVRSNFWDPSATALERRQHVGPACIKQLLHVFYRDVTTFGASDTNVEGIHRQSLVSQTLRALVK